MKHVVIAGMSVLFALILGGCPSGDGAGNENLNANLNENSTANENANLNGNVNDNSADDSPSLLPGVWHRTSTETMQAGGDTELDYMVLNDDYTAVFHFRSPSLGLFVCHHGLFLPGPGIMFLAFPNLFEGTLMGQYEMVDANTVSMVSPDGETIVFEHVDALPAEYVCGELAVTNTFTALPRPDSDSGLAYDGTQLWYTLDASLNLQPVAPGTGAAGAPVAALTYPYVQACQGTDFWLIQSGSKKTQLRNQGNVLMDEVDTDVGLATPTTIHAVTYDADDHVLWIHGTASGLGVGQMLRVNSDAEPDVLIGVNPLDVEIEALAWHSATLWALIDAGPYIVVQFDPVTLVPVRTYLTPRPEAHWRGLAWIGDSLYLIGDEAGEGVLVQTQLAP